MIFCWPVPTPEVLTGQTFISYYMFFFRFINKYLKKFPKNDKLFQITVQHPIGGWIQKGLSMTTAGIIAEYNPFHNGHLYHIQETRKITGADYILVIMSGDFVQRGEPALMDLRARTEMALRCGADLVLELPVFFSCASAETFAAGGITILNQLHSVDFVSFGAENANADPAFWQEAAHFLAEEPPCYQNLLREHLRNGLTWPAAREKALLALLGDQAALLARPNNILALEYLRSLIRLKSSIRPVFIQRTGNDYHDLSLSGASASASAIRSYVNREAAKTSRLLPGDGSFGSTSSAESLPGTLAAVLPPEALTVLQKNWLSSGPVTADDFSLLLHYRLLRLHDAGELTAYCDIGPDLANRIFRLRGQFRNFSTFAELVKTKNTTLLHVQRALLHLILDLKTPSAFGEKGEFPLFSGPVPPYYTRILGMKRSAANLLHKIKQNTQIPVLSKLADADRVFDRFEAYEEQQKKTASLQLQETVLASHIYQSVLVQKYEHPFIHEAASPILIL